MKIYTFDDKAEQVEKSHEAVIGAGHEVACLRNSCLGSISRSAEKLATETDYGLGERLKARLFSEVRGAVRLMVQERGGIITDLMFHNKQHQAGAVLPPAGLLVVIHAIANGVPVVVCTDASETAGHHHGEAIGWIFDGYVSQFKDWRPSDHCKDHSEPPPFGWVEDKDWEKAISLLAAIRAKMDNPPTSSA
ncbi:MAG: hypothetical protein ACYC8S_03595 [Minisyncoccota bacterium]